MTMPTGDRMFKPRGEARRIEVFTGAGRRREWSAEQKAAIVAESYEGTSSVCDVARQHGLTPTQLFTWRQDPAGNAVQLIKPYTREHMLAVIRSVTVERSTVRETTKRVG